MKALELLLKESEIKWSTEKPAGYGVRPQNYREPSGSGIKWSTEKPAGYGVKNTANSNGVLESGEKGLLNFLRKHKLGAGLTAAGLAGVGAGAYLYNKENNKDNKRK